MTASRRKQVIITRISIGLLSNNLAALSIAFSMLVDVSCCEAAGALASLRATFVR